MFFLRTKIYADHFAQGDFIPIWSSADNFGLGSPMPLLYHKLHYMVAGTFHYAIQNVQASTILTLWFFMTLGGYGMYRLVSHVCSSKNLGLCAGSIFIMANYTTTNWLVRGAMAEFTGAMLVPAVLYFFVRSCLDKSEKKMPYGNPALLGLFMALTFLSHSVLAYYLGLSLAVAAAVLLVYKKITLDSGLIRQGTVAIGVFAICLSPILAAMATLGSDYDMSRIIYDDYHPVRQFRGIERYLTGAWDFFGKNWLDLPVQLDIPVLMLAIFGLYMRFSKRDTIKTIGRNESVSIFLISVVVFCLFLQTPWSRSFYEYFPGAKFIQFPWRLLAIITPALIALAMVAITPLNSTIKKYAVSACLILSGIVCGAFSPIKYGEIPATYSVYPKHLSFSANGEYTPNRAKRLDPTKDPKISSTQCRVTREGETNTVDQLVIKYTFTCPEKELVVLPLYASPYHRIQVKSASGEKIDTAACELDERARCAIELPQCNGCGITVHNPTIASVLSQNLRSRFF